MFAKPSSASGMVMTGSSFAREKQSSGRIHRSGHFVYSLNAKARPIRISPFWSSWDPPGSRWLIRGSVDYETVMANAINSGFHVSAQAAGMILIYPITIIAGSRAVMLVISSLCFGLDVWSPQDAGRNLLQGLPILAALAALWVTVAIPPAGLARTWRAFVPAVTGLIMVLSLEGMVLLTGLPTDSPTHISMQFPILWVVGGPMVVAAFNLVRLIRARNRIGAPEPLPDSPAVVPVIPRPHLPLAAGQRTVTLIPYRGPESRAAQQPSAMTLSR
jgi:hypothetical protein